MDQIDLPGVEKYSLIFFFLQIRSEDSLSPEEDNVT